MLQVLKVTHSRDNAQADGIEILWMLLKPVKSYLAQETPELQTMKLGMRILGGNVTYNFAIPMLFPSHSLVGAVGFRVAVHCVLLQAMVAVWYPNTMSVQK